MWCKFFVERAAKGGVDIFRVFDSLNWVDNMRVAMDAVCESDKLCEAAICYTGDLGNPNRPKYNLKYYVDLAKQLEKSRRAHPRHQGHGGPVQAAARRASWSPY